DFAQRFFRFPLRSTQNDKVIRVAHHLKSSPDHLMVRRGFEMVRYANDFVILCGTKGEAEEALREVAQWTQTNGLMLHPGKTQIVDAAEKGGFDFLGFHFERGHRWPRKKSLRKLKETIR